MREAASAAVGFLLFLSPALQPAGVSPRDPLPSAPDLLPSIGLATGPGSQVSPDLEERFLVWEDDRTGHPNVRLRDLMTSQEYSLGGSSTRQSRFPQIRNGLVSFVDAPTKDTGIGPSCSDRSTFCIVLYNATTGVRSQYLNLNGLAPVATTDAYFVTVQTLWSPGMPSGIWGYHLANGTWAFAGGPGEHPVGLMTGPVGGDDFAALSVRHRGTYTICPDVYDFEDPAARARPCTNEVGVFFVGNRTLAYLTKSIDVADRHDPFGSYRVNCWDFTWESYPRLSGGLVVWQDNRNSAFVLDAATCTWTGNRWDVYGFDLTTWREVPLLVNPWNETHPDVDGNLLVWADDRNGNWDVYARFLDTGQELQVTNDPATQRNPVVSKGCIAWEDDRHGDWDIHGTCFVGVPRLVSLDVDPDTLNLKSQGKWVTAYIEAENASVTDIDPYSLRLNGVAPAWTRLRDDTLVAKVDRAAFAATVPPGEGVVVTLTGLWKDGNTFIATDTIRVIRSGR